MYQPYLPGLEPEVIKATCKHPYIRMTSVAGPYVCLVCGQTFKDYELF